MRKEKWFFYGAIVLIVVFISSGFKRFDSGDIDWLFTVDGKLSYNVPTQKEFEITIVKGPLTGKTFAGFKQALAFKESQGKYSMVNTLGYLGKYQFGLETLRIVGVYDSLHFMNSPKLQESAFRALLSRNKWELRQEIEKYEGTYIDGVLITESGLLAAAHLGGVGSVKRFLKSNGKRSVKDAYGTSVRKYIKMFEGYDTSSVLPDRKAKARTK